VRALGAEPGAASSANTPPAPSRASWTTGLAALRRYLVETVRVDTLDFRLRDGSGLSAQNVVTPRMMIALLEHARRQPWGEDFRRAMAEPGEAGSTLANRLQGMSGRLHAKTGTLTNVAALSGYVTRSDGSLVIFSILTNASGIGASGVQPGIDQIVRALAGS